MSRDFTMISHLRQNVVKNFGKNIVTATDCENLASLLHKNFGSNISAQTIRRFFGIITSSSKPGTFTLNLLSMFCGFRDYEDFRKIYANSELELFFGETENPKKDYWQKSEQLCRQISESPELLSSTHHQLMSYPIARKYFIENHPMRDMLGTLYSHYFLAYLKYSQTAESKIFAYGFLFQSAFLQQNSELVELCYKKIKDTEISEKIHVIPAALKFGVELLFADISGNEHFFGKTFNNLKNARIGYIKDSEKSVCSFEYTVLESLIFTNRLKEIKFLIENQTFQKEDDKSYVPSQRKQTHDEVWKILCAAGYHKIGDRAKTQSYLNEINLENLGFGWKKYYSIICYFVLLDFTAEKEHEETLLKLQNLIDETYFCYFDDRLKKLREPSPPVLENEFQGPYEAR